MKNQWGPGMDHTYIPQDIAVLTYRIEDSQKDYEVDLTKRIFRFAVDAMDLFRSIPYSKETNVVRFQLAKSAISVGAKYEGSQRTGSSSDVRYKLGSALRQAREANYWLEVMQRMEIGDQEKIGQLITESGEIKTALEKVFRNIL